jgi:hypothetical protein
VLPAALRYVFGIIWLRISEHGYVSQIYSALHPEIIQLCISKLFFSKESPRLGLRVHSRLSLAAKNRLAQSREFDSWMLRREIEWQFFTELLTGNFFLS